MKKRFSRFCVTTAQVAPSTLDGLVPDVEMATLRTFAQIARFLAHDTLPPPTPDGSQLGALRALASRLITPAVPVDHAPGVPSGPSPGQSVGQPKGEGS
jgi:hypothetical protein